MGTRLALVMAVALAIVAALAGRAWLVNERAELERREMLMEIVAAFRPLRKGDTVRLDDLSPVSFPQHRVVDGMVPWAERRMYLGRVLTVDIDKNAPLFRSFLELNRGKSVIAESPVSPGKRAVTLRVDAESAQAFMIRPGDYVDVLGTFESLSKELPETLRTPGRSDDGRESVTARLYESSKVLAVDNRTVAASSDAVAAAGYRTLTLELDPVSAGRLIDAQNKGKLTFLLRARGDAERDDEGVTPYRWQDIQP